MKQMKTQSIFLTILAILLISFASCNRNKMRQNESSVKKQLLEDEEVIAEKKRLEEEKAKAFADSIAKLPKGFRLKANRSVDSKHPPIVLDIEEARSRVHPIKYSQLGKSIRYIKLSHDLEEDFLERSKALLTPQGIVISGVGGAACFYNDGVFKEIICINDKLWKKGKGYWTYDREVYAKYKGMQGNPFFIDNKVYYKYVNRENKQGYLMEYDMLQPRKIGIGYDVENNQHPKPKGKQRMPVSTRTDVRQTDMAPLDKYHFTTNKSKWNSSKSGYFLTAHSFSGDTVCQLKDFDPIKNYTASNYRGAEGNSTYRLNGHLHFRQNFNDTIYRFEAVNRVKPVYVIDFGKKKITSSMEGINPKYDLTDKYVVDDILETNKFLFVFYTKDYACPNTAIKGTLQYNCFVYDKTTNKTFHAYINESAILHVPKNSKMPPFPISPPKGIINDLDYGIITWKFNQDEDGRLYKLINTKDIKEHLQSTPKNTNTTNKELLEKITEHSKDNDLFLMIIE